MNFVQIFYLIVGLLLCLFGFKMQKIALFLSWFLLSFGVCLGILDGLLGNERLVLILCFTISILFGCLGYKLEKFSVFVAVTYFSYEILGTFLLFEAPFLNFLFQIGVALLVGGLAVFFMKPVMICVTSLYGGVLLNEALNHFVLLPSYLLSIAVVLIVLMSMVFQFKTNKKS